MLIRRLLLQYSKTTEKSKLPCPHCQTHPLCYYVASLLASLHWLPIRQRVTFKFAGLIYRSLHETSPTYLSSVLHAYTPTWTLWSSSAHLLVEPRLRTTLTSRGFQSAGLRIWNSLPNHIKLAPSFPRSDPDLKRTSLLQLVNNWSPSELSVPLIRCHTRFNAHYKCFLHYIHIYITLHVQIAFILI